MSCALLTLSGDSAEEGGTSNLLQASDGGVDADEAEELLLETTEMGISTSASELPLSAPSEAAPAPSQVQPP